MKVGSWTDTDEAPSAFSSAWALPASRAAVMALATVLAFIVMAPVRQQTADSFGGMWCELERCKPSEVASRLQERRFALSTPVKNKYRRGKVGWTREQKDWGSGDRPELVNCGFFYSMRKLRWGMNANVSFFV